jgi:hypothetical protein
MSKKKPTIYERIPNGGLPEKISYEDAKEYAQLHIDTEMRDPNGLDRDAKVYLAMFARISKLEDALRFYAIELQRDVEWVLDDKGQRAREALRDE